MTCYGIVILELSAPKHFMWCTHCTSAYATKLTSLCICQHIITSKKTFARNVQRFQPKHFPPPLADTWAETKSAERRLTLGACIVWFAVCVNSPYVLYTSVLDSTLAPSDYERHFLIMMGYYVLVTVVNPFTLFITSPTVRRCFVNDWFACTEIV